jgi:hypothetical protein
VLTSWRTKRTDGATPCPPWRRTCERSARRSRQPGRYPRPQTRPRRCRRSRTAPPCLFRSLVRPDRAGRLANRALRARPARQVPQVRLGLPARRVRRARMDRTAQRVLPVRPAHRAPQALPDPPVRTARTVRTERRPRDGRTPIRLASPTPARRCPASTRRRLDTSAPQTRPRHRRRQRHRQLPLPGGVVFWVSGCSSPQRFTGDFRKQHDAPTAFAAVGALSCVRG